VAVEVGAVGRSGADLQMSAGPPLLFDVASERDLAVVRVDPAAVEHLLVDLVGGAFGGSAGGEGAGVSPPPEN